MFTNVVVCAVADWGVATSNLCSSSMTTCKKHRTCLLHLDTQFLGDFVFFWGGVKFEPVERFTGTIGTQASQGFPQPKGVPFRPCI